MRRTKEHKDIFDVVKQERTHSRTIESLKKQPLPPSNQQPTDVPFNELWPREIERMVQELQQLQEQLKVLERAMGMSFSQALSIPEHFSPEQKKLLHHQIEQKDEDLKKLIVLPQFYKQQLAKEAREEKRHSTTRTVGKRKKWLSL